MIEKQNLNRHLKGLEDMLNHWKQLNNDEKKERVFIENVLHMYIYFRDEQLPSLLAAMNGRNDGIAESNSLIGIKNNWFYSIPYLIFYHNLIPCDIFQYFKTVMGYLPNF